MQGSSTVWLQFLHAVSQSVVAHTDTLQLRADSSDSGDDDVVDLTNEGPVTLPASSASTSSASATSAAPDDCCRSVSSNHDRV